MMDPSRSRFPFKTAAAVAAVLLAAFAARRALRPSPETPAAPSAGMEVRSSGSGSPGADGGAPAAAAAPPPAEARGYVRRLVVVEPPAPGQARREARGEDQRREETAPGRGSSFAGPAGSFAAEYGEGAGTGPSWRAGAPPAPPAPSGAPGTAAAPPALPPAAGARKPPPRDGRTPPDPAGDDTRALADASSAASRLVAGARAHRNDASARSPLTPEAVATAIRQQLAQDARTASSVRSALSSLPAGASDGDKETAVAGALAAAGEPSGPEDVAQAMAEASQPSRPAPTPQAVEAAIRDVSSDPPSVARQDELSRTAMEPEPKPSGPPPRGGVAAYVQYRDAFDKAETTYGLKPSQLVPFPAIETSLGANTGKYPTRDVLWSIYNDPKGRFRPSQRAQAGRDLTALTRLESDGDLGGRTVKQIYGSNMGAIGITQFLPTSWKAYGVSMSGGPRNPWDFRDAVMSTANYLEKHGSRRDYDHAILTYNHSEDYRQKIRQYGTNVAPGIAAVRERDPSPAASPAPAKTP